MFNFKKDITDNLFIAAIGSAQLFVGKCSFKLVIIWIYFFMK